jgi:hypothetical protein
MHKKVMIKKLNDYCYYVSHKNFPYVEPISKGRAIICPIIDGATDVSLYIYQAISHL